MKLASGIGMRIRCRWASLGKPREFPYAIGGERFLVRRGTSDVFTLHEVWTRREYLEPSPGAIVVDCGANIGGYSVLAARRGARVFAFEPMADNIRLLEENVRAFPNVTVFPRAIAGSGGTRTIAFDPARPGCASIIREKGRERENIRAVTLARVFDLCRIHRIDLLKMDIEGAEHEILLSTPRDILRRIGAITMEFHDFLPGQRHSSLVSVLEDADFAVTCRPHPCYRWERTGSLNALRSAKLPSDIMLPP